MTLREAIAITCDHHGCPAEHVSQHYLPPPALRDAARHGWVEATDPDRDYCLEHASDADK